MKAAALALFAVLSACPAAAQTPYLNDDTEVAAHDHLHLEWSNHYDALSSQDLPNRQQYTGVLDIKWGVLPRLEAGFDIPLLALVGTADSPSRSVWGLGDLDFSIKGVLLEEKEGSSRPSLALVFALELPTGNPSNGLGSGRTDFGFNLVAARSLTKDWTLTANLGVLLTGNTKTGAEGLSPARGAIYTGGASLKRALNADLEIGVEVWGSSADATVDQGSELRIQIAATQRLSRTTSLVLAYGIGWYASPRAGGLLGIAADF